MSGDGSDLVRRGGAMKERSKGVRGEKGEGGIAKYEDLKGVG